MRTEKEIVAAIEELQKLGDPACLNGHRPGAQELLNEWINLPTDDDDEMEVGDLPPIPSAVNWLWDLLEPLPSPPEEFVFEVIELDDLDFVHVDVEQWITATTEILFDGWQQFERFQFQGDGADETGDLAAKASSLWMQFDLMDPAVRHQHLMVVFRLHSELEGHIDPEGVIAAGREEMHNKKRAAELRAEGKFDQAAEWDLPKEQWKRPRNALRTSGKRSSTHLIDGPSIFRWTGSRHGWSWIATEDCQLLARV